MWSKNVNVINLDNVKNGSITIEIKHGREREKVRKGLFVIISLIFLYKLGLNRYKLKLLNQEMKS